MKQYYQNNWAKVVESFGTNIYKGLLEYDCILRREQFGDNKLDMPIAKGIGYILKEKFNIWNLLLYIGILTYFVLSRNIIFLAVWSVTFLSNLTYTIYLGIKEKKDIESLGNINSVQVTVLREGIERVVAAHELVKGDIVLFKKNSFISADLRIISADNLKVDERNITGDKILKDKYATMMDYEVSDIGAINNMLFKGSVVKEGSGTGIVVETGSKTQLGILLSSLVKSNLKKTNIIKNIDSVIGKIHIILILISIILYLIVPGKGKIKNDVLLSSIFVSTTILSWLIIFIFSKKIIKELNDEGIIITNLSSLQDCRDIKVLFVEKYGTITEEKLVVKKAYFDDQQYNIESLDVSKLSVERLINNVAINTNIYQELKSYHNDIYAEAYIEFLKEKNININDLIRKNRLKFRVGIDSGKDIITTVTKNSKGYRANSRGNIESILQKCTSILINDVERPLTTEEINKIKLADLCFAREGLISEAMAYRNFNYEPSEEENVESNMVFIGLVGLENPSVEGIEDDIEALFDEGILPLVFCEDNKIVAEILGRKIGLISSSQEVISGLELSYMSEKEFYKTVSNTRIFCRLTPEQKNIIINAFDKDGFPVAVEGETLSDLSNIAIARLGITKGKAPNLLRKIGEFHTDISSIKSLLKIRKKSAEVFNSFYVACFAYVQLVLGQIFAMSNYYFIDDKNLFGNYPLVILNTVFTILIILLSLNCNNIISRNQLLINIAIYIVVNMVSILSIEKGTELVVFLVLTINMLITALKYTKINRENTKMNIIITLLALITIVAGTYITIYTAQLKVNALIFELAALFIIIYYLMIVLTERWQD